jgi:RIO kinase 1
MSSNNVFDLTEQLEELEDIPPIRNVPKEKLRKHPSDKNRKRKGTPVQVSELTEQENEFAISYTASKHEKEWLTASLKDFYQQQWFDDILRLIKGGGKEASVYQCLANSTIQSRYIAAKVYRPRKFRQLRNDSLYREGRLHLDDEGHEIHDEGVLHAIAKHTHFGMEQLHTSWIEHEFQTMRLLHEAGVDIPKPLASGNNAILMEYIGWDDMAAPTLNTVKLPVSEARKVFDRVIQNIEIMLQNQRVHGDLSAYNVLYFEGDIFLIDFPQSLNPEENRNAYSIFQRDIRRLSEYFHGMGIQCQPHKLSEDLWSKHRYDINQTVDPRLIDPDFLDL